MLNTEEALELLEMLDQFSLLCENGLLKTSESTEEHVLMFYLASRGAFFLFPNSNEVGSYEV